jgi:hypothetical protein
MIPQPSIHQDIARQRHGDRLHEAAQARLARTVGLEHEPGERRVAGMRLARLLRLRRARAAAVVEPAPATNAE